MTKNFFITLMIYIWFIFPIHIYAKDFQSPSQWLYYEDINNDLNINQAALQLDKNGIVNYGQIMSKGYTNSTFWIKLKFSKIKNFDYKYLVILPPVLDQVEIYQNISGKNKKVLQSGDLYSSKDKTVNFRGYATLVDIENLDENLVFYIKIKTMSSMLVNAKIYTEEGFLDLIQSDNLFFGLMLGGFFVLFVINFLYIVRLRDRFFVYYFLYLFLNILIALFTFGIMGYFFDLTGGFYNNFLMIIIFWMTSIGILFYMQLLKIDKSAGWYHKSLIFLTWFLFALSFLVLFDQNVLVSKVLFIVIIYLLLSFLIYAFIRPVLDVVENYFNKLITFISVISILITYLQLNGLYSDIYIFNNVHQFATLINLTLIHYLIYRRFDNLKSSYIKSQFELDKELILRNSQSDFMAILFHEIKNPLSVIDASVKSIELIQYDALDHRLMKIKKAVQSMQNLFSKLIDYQKFNSFTLNVKMKRINMANIFCQIIESRQDADIKLESDEDIEILGDEWLLEILLNNLIDNSCKYATGKPILIKIQKTENNVRLKYTDYGMGLPNDVMSRLFVPYTRSKLNPHIQGVGLGLFIIHRIALLHNAVLTYEYSEENGSCFTFNFERAN